MPPNRTLIGNGATLRIVGQKSGVVAFNDPDLWNAFQFQPGGSVTLDNVFVEGENNPFDGLYVQNQNSVFWFPHGGTYTAIRITNCTFRNLYGFSMNGGITAVSCVIEDNTAQECGNGMNISCDGMIYRGNTLISAESIETSGDNTLIENNTLRESSISAGGNTAPVPIPGLIVRNNDIENTRGAGITVAEMAVGAVVENNTIRSVRNGIVITSPWEGTWIDTPTIRENIIENVMAIPAGANGVGIYVFGDVRNCTIEDNTVTDAVFGAQIRVNGAVLKRNILRGSVLDLFVQSDVTEITLEDNDYVTSNYP